MSIFTAHSAETRGGCSAFLSAVFAFTFVHTGWSTSALGVFRSVSFGIAPRIGDHAVVISGVAGSSRESSNVRAGIAILVDSEVSADREDISRLKLVPSIAAFCASFFYAVHKAVRKGASDDRTSRIFNGVILVPLEVADDGLRGRA